MIGKNAQSLLVDKSVAKEFREWFRWKYSWYGDLDIINFPGLASPTCPSGREISSTWFTFWDWDENKKNIPWSWSDSPDSPDVLFSKKIYTQIFLDTHYAEYKRQTSLLEPKKSIDLNNWSLFVIEDFQEDFDEWFRHFFSHRDVSKATTKCNGKNDWFNCYIEGDDKLDWRWSKDPELSSIGNVITAAQWREQFWLPYYEEKYSGPLFDTSGSMNVTVTGSSGPNRSIDSVEEISKILDEEITKSMVKNLQEMNSEMQSELNNDLMLLL
jgi:hypothetical protein